MKDLDSSFRALMVEVIRRAEKSRDQIAEEMSARLGRRVTAHMINGYTAESKEPARFPAAWVEAFCYVTGDDRLQRLVLSDRLRRLLELAEEELSTERSKRRTDTLRKELIAEQD